MSIIHFFLTSEQMLNQLVYLLWIIIQKNLGQKNPILGAPNTYSPLKPQPFTVELICSKKQCSIQYNADADLWSRRLTTAIYLPRYGVSFYLMSTLSFWYIPPGRLDAALNRGACGTQFAGVPIHTSFLRTVWPRKHGSWLSLSSLWLNLGIISCSPSTSRNVV